MRIGFSGTQIGMSLKQRETLRQILVTNNVTEFHHGDCIGADDQADDLCIELFIRVVLHPPLYVNKRAHCELKTHRRSPLIILDPKGYIERNHNIVDATDSLIAAPKSNREELRSGTWATYRYARKSKPIILLER